MDEPATERWKQLCEQAAREQDPEKLLALVTEINRLLEEKDRPIKPQSIQPQSVQPRIDLPVTPAPVKRRPVKQKKDSAA